MEDGKVIGTGTNDASGTIHYPEIAYVKMKERDDTGLHTFMVTGAHSLIVNFAENVNSVTFDSNVTSGYTGEMQDQDMVYDKSQNLFGNQYQRIGWTFAGWNTKKDGS